jgi:diguanylate cyclase (GGDEF)-like protein
MTATGDQKGPNLHAPGASPGDDSRTMALLLGVLFVVAAVLGALTLLLPHPGQFDDGPLFSNCVIALFFGAVLLASADRLPRWSLQIGVALGSLAITRAVYFSHEPNAYYTFFYLWPILYSFYFFGRFWGLVQMTILGGAYAWVLTQIPTDTPASLWLMTIASLTVAGLLIDLLARRLRHREAESAMRARALAAVGSVAHDLALRTTTESAALATCEAAAEVTGATGAALWQPTSDGTGLEVTASTDPELVGAVVLLVGEPSGSIRAFNTRERLFVADAPASGDVNQKLVAELNTASILFEPIMRDGNPIGVLTILWDTPVPALPQEVDQVIALLAAESSIAIDRAELLARLERAARTDDLTGLPNRRAWDEYLARELAHAKRLDTPLCVAILDLDHFKEYNDNHGHQAGDRFLKEAAAAWQTRIRETDLIARYGGEEFAVALVDCQLQEAAEMLELLRRETPEDESSSVGLAAWNGSEGEDELLARADAALYEAKRTGRDRVIVA